MSQSFTSFLVHYGPLRAESQAIIERNALPTLLINTHGINQKHTHLPALEHSKCLLALKAGDANLYTYNVATFNSLAPATGLKTLYPGLQVKPTQVVKTHTLDKVISAYISLPSYFSQLIIEQSEQALLLLNSWQEEGLLDQLERLYVRTSAISLYENMATHNELNTWCKEHGFELDENIDLPSAEDPEIILACFQRNPLYVSLKKAKLENERLKKESEIIKQKYENEILELTRAKEEIEALKNENDKLQKRRNELKKMLEGMHELESIKAERDRFAEQASDRQQQVHEMQRQNQKLQCDNLELQKKQLSFQSELAKAEAHVEMIKELMLNG